VIKLTCWNNSFGRKLTTLRIVTRVTQTTAMLLDWLAQCVCVPYCSRLHCRSVPSECESCTAHPSLARLPPDCQTFPVNTRHSLSVSNVFAYSALTLLEGNLARKNWVMGCWCGYLSGAKCRLFACGPADATAPQTPSSLGSFKSRLVLPFWYRLTPRFSWKRPLNGCSVSYSSSTHTHTHPFNGRLSRTTRVSRYQEGKTNLNFAEAVTSPGPYASLHLAPDR